MEGWAVMAHAQNRTEAGA